MSINRRYQLSTDLGPYSAALKQTVRYRVREHGHRAEGHDVGVRRPGVIGTDNRALLHLLLLPPPFETVTPVPAVRVTGLISAGNRSRL